MLSPKLREYRPAFAAALDIDDYRQVFVINHHQINRISGRITIGGDHGSDRMTDEINLIRGEHSIVRDLQTRQCAGAGHWSNLFGDVFAGVNSDDAGALERFGGIDAIDARMRVDRTDERNVQRVRKSDVVDVVCQTLDQPRIFGAFDSLSNVFACIANLRKLRCQVLWVPGRLPVELDQ